MRYWLRDYVAIACIFIACCVAVGSFIMIAEGIRHSFFPPASICSTIIG